LEITESFFVVPPHIMTFHPKLLFLLLILSAFVVPRAWGQPVSAVEPLGMTDERFGVLSYLEPCDILLDANGGGLFVLNAGSRDLRKIPLIDNRPPLIFQFNIEPVHMTQSPDGKHIAIVGGGVQGKLLLVDAETLQLEKTVAVGHTPSDVAVFKSGDTMTAYVANRFGGDISVVDLITGKESARWKAGREPIALDLTPDGTRLVTVGHLPEDSMQFSNPRCRARIFDTATGGETIVPLFRSSMNARDLVVSPDGRYAFISCILAHFEQIPSLIENGWINENVLAAVDLETNTFADVVYLDESMSGAANPWGLAVSSDNRYLAVAHAGSCEISLLNLPRIMQRLDTRPNRKAQGYGH
jgi:DNA-binding beta-propeller fold protein YncE